MAEKFQAVVIGGGPGGYVCAIRLAQLGLKTACIESRGTLGGTCLNVGCIPSKSLLNLSEEFHKVQNLSNKGIEIGEVKLNLSKMMKSKDKAVTILTKGVEFLLKKNKVTYFKGTGSFKSKNEVSIKDEKNKETIISSEKIIIATGSVPVSLPGIDFDEKIIVSSTGALKLEKVPKKMVVVGGGYIGLEMGSVWSRLGSEVHVIEFLDHITPGMDKEISQEFMKILKKQGINFHMQHKVEAVKSNVSGAIVSTKDKDGNQKDFNTDIVLVSVGRKPNTNGLNLEKIGVELDHKKRIKTNKDLLSGLRAEVRQKAKGAEARLNSISGYIRNMEKYLRDGDWVDNFYGADQEKKIRWRCVDMAYYPDGTPKRDVGTYYDDIMEVYTKEMAMADGVLSGPSKTDKPKRKRRSKKNK